MANNPSRTISPWGGNVNAPAPTPASPGVTDLRGQSAPYHQANTNPSAPWQTDPGYLAAQNSYQRMLAQQKAWLQQQQLQAQGAFNGAGNQFSYMAQLGRSDADRTRGYQNNLAARGILNSGEYGYQAGEEARWKAQQQYDGEQQLLAALNGYQQQYLGAVGGAQDSLNSALQQAYQNYQNDPSAYGHWTSPNSPAGYMPFTPTAYQDPNTAISLITQKGLFK